MNKRDIKKFLEIKEEELINKSIELENQLLEKYKIGKIKKLNNYSEFKTLEDDLNCLLPSLTQINCEIEDLEEFRTYGNSLGSLAHLIQRVSELGIDGFIKDSIKTSYDKDNKIEIKARQERKKIMNEFIKLRGNTSGMNAKKATEYLTNLGFKIIEQKVIKVENAILAPIDMNVLNI